MAEFTNQATLRYGGSVLYSNVVSGTIEAALTLQKTAAAQSYTPGGTLSYAISIVNNGPEAYTGLTLTDDLGAYEAAGGTVQPLHYSAGSARLFVNGVLQAAPTAEAGPPLRFTGLSVPAGGSAVLVYEAALTEYASPEADGMIVNTATLSGPGLLEPLTATATVPAAQAASLRIVKALEPATVRAQGQIVYSFTVENLGNAPASDLTLEDVFDPILSGLEVALDGVVWTLDTEYSYDPATGEFKTLPGELTVGAASFTQDPTTGVWQTTPAQTVLTVRGTI